MWKSIESVPGHCRFFHTLSSQNELYRTTMFYRQESQRLLDNNFIDTNRSDCNSPRIVVSKKPDGIFRMCIDCREVDSITKPGIVPFPRSMTALITSDMQNMLPIRSFERLLANSSHMLSQGNLNVCHSRRLISILRHAVRNEEFSSNFFSLKADLDGCWL